jgi:hypothetical protein
MGTEKQQYTPLKRLARMMFKPRDKNPYVFNGKPLKDLQDLKDYLVAFTGREALWVASWLEYLGDSETAERIRKKPEKFKSAILKRYEELKPYA